MTSQALRLCIENASDMFIIAASEDEFVISNLVSSSFAVLLPPPTIPHLSSVFNFFTSLCVNVNRSLHSHLIACEAVILIPFLILLQDVTARLSNNILQQTLLSYLPETPL
jgi:hypothetical protein